MDREDYSHLTYRMGVTRVDMYELRACSKTSGACLPCAAPARRELDRGFKQALRAAGAGSPHGEAGRMEVSMAGTATARISARCPAGLLTGIRAVTRKRADWAETASLVADELRRHLPSPDILTAAERAGDPDGYVQHILHAEDGGSFSVVALVWRPGQITPIHDHVTWCVVGVVAGTEHEELYELRGGEAGGYLARTAARQNLTGTVSGFAPPGDIHRVRNCAQQTAISIHIYGADISRLGSSVRRCYDLPVLSA